MWVGLCQIINNADHVHHDFGFVAGTEDLDLMTSSMARGFMPDNKMANFSPADCFPIDATIPLSFDFGGHEMQSKRRLNGSKQEW